VIPSPPTLVTARLRLRPLVATDAEALHRIQSDAEHMRYYPHPFSRQETEDWIVRARASYEIRGFGLLAVEDAATGDFLGNVGPTIQRVDGVDEIELGWSITPTRARQGIATEAAEACRTWVFEAAGADHVIALVRPENEPSRGVARNIGMTIWKRATHGAEGWVHDVWRIDRSDAVRPAG